MIRSLLELLGLACLAAAAFLVHPAVGLAALGLGLILAANFGGRWRDHPAIPARDARQR